MNDKQNYRPVSTLSNLSKVFEKLIYSQINTYMSDKFSKYLTGFRKNHNTQHALLNMIENWKSNLNKGNKVGTIFVGLSKVFDTLNHSLLIAKHETYGFNSLSLEFMQNYLTNRKQRCNVGKCFSIWRKFTTIINNLQTTFRTLKVWFYDNFLVLNSKKCHFMTLRNRNNLCNFSCDDIIIKNSLSVRILRLFVLFLLGFFLFPGQGLFT